VLILFGMDAEAAPLEARLGLTPEELQRVGPVAESHIYTARAMRALAGGDVVAYLVICRASVAALDRAGAVRRALNARSNLGFALSELGAYAEAEGELRQALGEMDRLQLGEASASLLLGNLGWALMRTGRTDDGLAMERRALAAAGKQRYDEGATRIYLGRMLSEAGHIAEAEVEVRRAAEIFPADTPLGCYVRAVLADVLRLAGRTDEAVAAAEDARRYLGNGRELYEGDAFARIVIADVLAAAGRVEEAGAERKAARTRIRERAERIRDAALRSSFLRIPEIVRTLADR
jgi:tetratricopeptide (TPR) repeat protein